MGVGRKTVLDQMFVVKLLDYLVTIYCERYEESFGYSLKFPAEVLVEKYSQHIGLQTMWV